ncbi:MAG: hypothetical protein Kow00109_22180 [Acidobacteriota bacterium]
MKRQVKGVVLVLMLLTLLVSMAGPVFGAVDDPVRFLREVGVIVPPKHGVMVATLVTLLPSSGRIVVNSADQGTLALKLSDSADLRVMRQTVAADAFSRGDEVVIIVDPQTRTVKGVYKTAAN